MLGNRWKRTRDQLGQHRCIDAHFGYQYDFYSIRTGPFPVTLPASMGADRKSDPTTSAMPVVTTLMPELGGQRAFKRKGVGNDRPRLSLCRPAGRNFPQVSDPRRLRVVGGRKVDDNEIAL